MFDNLIHEKAMPVSIGIFVMHGKVKAANNNGALDRFNRSFEYDGLVDNHARIILDGSNDNNIYTGDWWMVNQTMFRALTFAG